MNNSKETIPEQHKVDLAKAEVLNRAFIVEQKKLEITEKNLERVQLKDNKLLDLHKDAQAELSLERKRQWVFIYVMLGVIVCISCFFFYYTGEKYLPDILKLAVGFVAGLSSSGFFRKLF